MNDRNLRNIVSGLGGRTSGIPRETGFDITAASEVTAILALARDLGDLRERLGNITIGQTYDGRPVTAEEIRCAGAMTTLLQGRDQAEPDPDTRGPAVPDARRAVRQHRPRQQLDRRRPARPEARRVPDHGVRVRVRPGHGEVHGHRLPCRRHPAARGGHRRDGARAVHARRRRPDEARRRDRDAAADRGRLREPREAHRERARVRHRAGRGRQPAARRTPPRSSRS